MNVAINMIEFNPGAMGGIETYIRNIVPWFVHNDRSNSYTVVCNETNAPYFSSLCPELKLKIVNNKRKSAGRLLRSFLRNILGLDLLSLEIDRMKMDVVHNPLTNVRPLKLRTPSVLTFHDMQHEYYPEFFTPRELRRRRKKYEKAARSAGRVIAISEHVRQGLVEKFAVSPDKIDVVYQGCGAEYQLLDDAQSAAVGAKYGLDRPFMYYPAATWPHKNHKNLLAALRILKEEHAFAGELVLTGIAMQSHGEILTEIDRQGLAGMVKVLGYLPYEELPYLYNLARVMVFPSLFEGFGIPLVEAMACGCPVVCSFVTSMPEIVGDAGVTFDPLSPADMAEKVLAVWNNSEERARMKQKGLERAKMFSWEETARRTLDVYRRAGAC